jgi:tetratricopeptide (TPR) repeat protein
MEKKLEGTSLRLYLQKLEDGMKNKHHKNGDRHKACLELPINRQDSKSNPNCCLLQTLPSVDRNSRDRQLRTLINKQVALGNYAEAIKILTSIIQQNPHNASDYNNRGLMYFRNGELTAAIADLNKAIELNPRLDNAYNNRANYYVKIGNLAAAIADYEIALDLNPANTRVWINQAITFRELGLYDLAIENLDIALVLSQTFLDTIYGERGKAYYLRGDWNLAIADYQRALSHCVDRHYQQQIQAWMDLLLEKASA